MNAMKIHNISARHPDQANNIRVTTPDGTSYYSGSENIMLINEKNDATTQKSAKSSESVKNY